MPTHQHDDALDRPRDRLVEMSDAVDDVDRLVADAVLQAKAEHEQASAHLTEEMAQPADPAVEVLVSDTLKLVQQPQTNARCDARILFLARFLRLFSFAAVTVVLLVLLAEAGVSGESVGVLLSLIMVGDLAISFYLTTHADRLGRKRTLLTGAALALLSAVAFGTSTSFFILVIAGTIGVISPGGAEVGPFLAVEQAALADLQSRDQGDDVASIAAAFGRYQFVGEVRPHDHTHSLPPARPSARLLTPPRVLSPARAAGQGCWHQPGRWDGRGGARRGRG